MSVLLPTGMATRTRPTPVEDEHGWVTNQSTGAPLTFPCNLQLNSGTAAVGAGEGGGAGPNAPRVVQDGVLYCDATTDVMPGDTITVGTIILTARLTRVLVDPAGLGNDCLVVEVEG